MEVLQINRNHYLDKVIARFDKGLQEAEKYYFTLKYTSSLEKYPEEIQRILQEKYSSTALNKICACVLNAILTHKRAVFGLSQPLINGLLKNDINLKKFRKSRTVSGQEYSAVLKLFFDLGFLRQVLKGDSKKKTVGVYEVIDNELLDFFGLSEEAVNIQLEEVLNWVQSKEDKNDGLENDAEDCKPDIEIVDNFTSTSTKNDDLPKLKEYMHNSFYSKSVTGKDLIEDFLLVEKQFPLRECRKVRKFVGEKAIRSQVEQQVYDNFERWHKKRCELKSKYLNTSSRLVKDKITCRDLNEMFFELKPYFCTDAILELLNMYMDYLEGNNCEVCKVRFVPDDELPFQPSLEESAS